MVESVIHWKHDFWPGQIAMECVMLRPGNYKATPLVKKCLLTFLNGRPAAATQRFHAVFYDLYKDFQIPPQTIPFVCINVICAESAFDIKILGDMRKFYFKP